MTSDEPLKTNTSNEFRIKVTLNPTLCDKTFKDALRATNKGHTETLLAHVGPQYRKRKEQVSNVFTGETNPKPDPHLNSKYIESKVMFNDFYVENNPLVNKGKLARYLYEKQIKDSSHAYSDELIIAPEKRKTIERRIKDNYGSNPIEILSKTQQDDLIKAKSEKNAKRQEVISSYLGSEKLKRTFKTLHDKSPNESTAKVTNQTFSLMKSSTDHYQFEPHHNKRHFRIASVNGVAFSYF